jgi:hypothetical protein
MKLVGAAANATAPGASAVVFRTRCFAGLPPMDAIAKPIAPIATATAAAGREAERLRGAASFPPDRRVR